MNTLEDGLKRLEQIERRKKESGGNFAQTATRHTNTLEGGLARLNQIQAKKTTNAQNMTGGISGFDSSILKSISDDWKSGWDYDLFDPEDMQRKAKGIMPKSVEAKYDLKNPTDRYLYENGLPYQNKFSDQYQAEEEKAREEAKKNAAYQKLYSSFRNEIYQKAYDAQIEEYANASAEGRNPQQLTDWEEIIASVMGQPKYADVEKNFYRHEEIPEITDYESMNEAAAIRERQKKMRENPNAFTNKDIEELITRTLPDDILRYETDQKAIDEKEKIDEAEDVIQQSIQTPALYTNALGAGGVRTLKQAKKTAESEAEDYKALLKNPDFAAYERRGRVSDAEKRLFDHSYLRHRYINDIGDTRMEVAVNAETGGTGDPYAKYQLMSEEERGIYNYLFAK